MRKTKIVLAVIVGFAIWVSLTSFLLDYFISRPVNSVVQTGIIILIAVYTYGFIHYIYTRITNKNR